MIPLPPKRRWSAIAETIGSKDAGTLGFNRPASANDAQAGISAKNGNREEYAVENRSHQELQPGWMAGQTLTNVKSRSVTPVGAPSVEMGQRRAKSGLSSASTTHVTTDPLGDNTTYLSYPELWRAVGFDPLGLGHEGLFNLRIYYQLGGRDLAEFQTLFSKLKDFFHQLRSFPVTPGIVYIPSDRRQVSVETIWMTVNANLDHLKFFAYHGHYAPISPNLLDKLTPLPHTMFSLDSRRVQNQPGIAVSQDNVPLPAARPLTWDREKGMGCYPQALSGHGVSPYEFYQRNRAVDTNPTLDVKNGYWDYQGEARQSLQLPSLEPLPMRAPASPQDKLTTMPERIHPSRMCPTSRHPTDVKRRKVDPSLRTSPSHQETDINHPRQGGAAQYPSWAGKQAQVARQWTDNELTAQASDYGIKQMPPLIPGVSGQRYIDAAWPQQVQKADQSHPPPQYGTANGNPDRVPWVKQEPPDETPDHALDLSVYREVNFNKSKVRGVACNMAATGDGIESRYRNDPPGEYFAKRSQVYSLKNMVDKTLSQQLPSNNNMNKSSVGRNADFASQRTTGNSGRYGRDHASQNKECEARHPQLPQLSTDVRARAPMSYDCPQDAKTKSVHSTTVQPADSSKNAKLSEQPSSSTGTGSSATGNKDRDTNDVSGGSLAVQTPLLPPRESNTQEEKTRVKEESEQTEPSWKAEVPDVKMITEGHSTLSHMLAGLVGYPLSLVTNINLGDHHTKAKKTSTKRISKTGAKILSWFLAGGTDHYDKVWDMIKDEFDINDDEGVTTEIHETAAKSAQKTLVRNFQSRGSERPQLSTEYVPKGSSDILGQLLSGLKSYDSEIGLHKYSGLNPKLDTDRDSEGESTYSCGSECGGCDICRGQTRGEDQWDNRFSVSPGASLRNSDDLKQIEENAVPRNGLPSYKMPLPARKRHLVMFQSDGGAAKECHSHSDQDTLPDHGVGRKLSDSTGAAREGGAIGSGTGPVLNCNNTSGELSPGNTSNSGATNTKCHLMEIDSADSSGRGVVGSSCLTSHNYDNDTNSESDTNTSHSPAALDLTNPRKRKVSLAMDSIPKELFVDDTNGALTRVDMDSSQLCDMNSDSSPRISSSCGEDVEDTVVSFSKNIGLSAPMSEWTASDVVRFITSIPGCEKYGPVFRQHSITGADLPHLTENYLQSVMKISQGAAIRMRLTMAAS